MTESEIMLRYCLFSSGCAIAGYFPGLAWSAPKKKKKKMF